MYGQRKLMSLRTPVRVFENDTQEELSMPPRPSGSPTHRQNHQRAYSSDYDTPSATDGETATDTEVLTETETDYDFDGHPKVSISSTPRPGASPRLSSSRPLKGARRRQAPSQHDILARFFRKDPIGLRNLDFMR